MWETLALAVVDTPLNQLIQATYWLWPILEIMHFLGLTLLFGGLLVVDLRMAGFNVQLDLSATHKLLPVVLIGFAINLLTGILFFYGDPMRYSINIGFQIKMGLIVLAGINAGYFHWKLSPMVKALDAGATIPLQVKLIAMTSLSTWFGVLLFGRLIPYVGTG